MRHGLSLLAFSLVACGGEHAASPPAAQPTSVATTPPPPPPAASTAAPAESPRQQASKLFKAGMQDVAEGRYDAGIQKLLQANQLVPHPNTTFNIARAYAEAGNLEEAVAYYKQYLATSPSDADKVEAVVKSLEARMAKGREAPR